MNLKLPKLEREIAALYIVTIFTAFSVTMLSPVLPEIKNEFQLSYTAASFILSSFAISRVILSLPSGYLYEKTSRKNLLLASMTLLSLGSLVAGLSRDFLTFLVSQVIMGAGFSVCFMVVIVSLSTSTTSKNRGKLLGMNSFARSIGAIIAPSFAGIVAVAFGWRSVFLIYTGLSAISLVFLYFLFSGKSGIARSQESEDDIKGYRKTLYGLLIIMFLANIVFSGFRGNSIPLYAGDVLKLDAGAIGLVLSLSALVFLVFAPLSAYLSDRHGRKIFIVLATLAFTLSTLGFLIAKTYLHLVLLLIFFGYGSIIFVSSTAMLGDITHAKQASRNFSIMRFIADLGMVIGPLATGFILDSFGFSITGWFFSVLSFLSFLIALYVLEEPKFRLDWKRLLNIATFGKFGE